MKSLCTATAEDESGQESLMQSCFGHVESSTGYGLSPLFAQNVIGQFSEEPKEASFPKKEKLWEPLESGGCIPSFPLNITATLPGWHGKHFAG